MPNEKLYRRGGVWWCRVRDRRGRIVRKSTHCRDYAAAVLECRNLEQQAVDPTYAAASEISLAQAIGDYLRDLERRRKSAATCSIAAQKCGHFVRIWKADLPLARIDSRLVESYMDQRQGEGVVDYTIKRELNHLRMALRIARHHGAFHLDMDRVFPPTFRASPKRKKRALSWPEFQAVLEQFGRRRQAHLAFLAATGARKSEAARARRGDVDLEAGMVHLRGTKTEGSDRVIPITPLVRFLIEYALEHAPGADLLFHPWANLWRDIQAACVRAQVEGFSPNDLRRSFTTWLRDAGLKPDLIAPLLGHTTDTLVQTTYGQLRPEALAGLVEKQLSGVPALYQLPASTRDSRLDDTQENTGNEVRPVRFERTTLGFEGRVRNARSVGTKLGVSRSHGGAIVPVLTVGVDPKNPESGEGGEPGSGPPSGRRFLLAGGRLREVGAGRLLVVDGSRVRLLRRAA